MIRSGCNGFGKNGELYECRVTGLRVTADSLTVLAKEKESGDEVQCHSPFELGCKEHRLAS